MTAAPEREAPDGARFRVMTISHAADLWLGELERRTHTDRTLDTYRRLLAKLADRHPHADVDDLTTAQLRRFLDEQGRRQDGQRKAARTIAQTVSIVNGFFAWLRAEGVIDRNPTERNGARIIARPPLQREDENDNIVTVAPDDVRRLLAAAETWGERLAVHCLAYLGPRRHALAVARITDYDFEQAELRLLEKGAKTIAKPVPHRLAALVEAAWAAGVYDEQPYLIPGRAQQRRRGDRDDRIIWHLVRKAAGRAKPPVKTHVHALRAAFADFYLETHPGQVEDLQRLMGHARLETTLLYLRRRRRRHSMETVRDLDWSNGRSEIRTREAGVDPTYPLSRRALSATQASVQNAEKPFEANTVLEPVGFQPSFEPMRLVDRVRSEHGPLVPREAAEGALQGP